jgi:hypothetical protein
VIPWTLMNVHGDITVATKYYPIMTAFIDFLTRHGDPHAGGLLMESQYGDFAHSDSCMSKVLNAIPNGQAGSFSHLLGMAYLIDIANATGHEADAQSYASLLRRLKTAYHTRYWNASRGDYGVSIAADVFALHLDVVPTTLRASVNASLIRKIELHLQNASRSGGVVAWRHLLQVLLKLQQPQLAVAIINSTLPGTLGHMFLPGEPQTTGTFWESACGDSNSRNHIMWAGGLGEFLYHAAGLAPSLAWGLGSERRPHFRVDPGIARHLRAANVSVATPAGRISVNWQLAACTFTAAVSVPHNSLADIHLPFACAEGANSQLFLRTGVAAGDSAQAQVLLWSNRVGVEIEQAAVVSSVQADQTGVRVIVASGESVFTLGRISPMIVNRDR